MVSEIRITHIEDQPETVDWLPDAIWNALESENCPWVEEGMPPEGRLLDNNIFESCFTLKKASSDEEVSVRYKVINVEGVGDDVVGQLANSHVAIVDMMTTTTDHQLLETGSDLVGRLLMEKSSVSIVVWTAYPAAVDENIKNSDRVEVFVKPPNVEMIVGYITKQMLDRLNGGTA